MGVGIALFGLFSAIAIVSYIVYFCRYFHKQRIAFNSYSLLVQILSIATLVGSIEFFPELVFNNSNGRIFGLTCLLVFLISSFGVFYFSSLEWKQVSREK